jgi:hypothetical protein
MVDILSGAKPLIVDVRQDRANSTGTTSTPTSRRCGWGL